MGLGYRNAGTLDLAAEPYQRVHYRGAFERTSLAEAYLKRRLHACFTLASDHPKGAARLCAILTANVQTERRPFGNTETDVASSYIRETVGWDESEKLIGGHFDRASGGDDEAVLVGYVEHMNGLYGLVPSLVWFEVLDRAEDIFSGVSQLSVLDGRIEFFRRPGPGKLDILRGWGLVPDDSEHDEVERAAKVVNGVASDEAYGLWNGCLAFDEAGRLSGFYICPDHEFGRFCGKIGLDFPLQVEDVMLRPGDFKNGWL